MFLTAKQVEVKPAPKDVGPKRWAEKKQELAHRTKKKVTRPEAGVGSSKQEVE